MASVIREGGREPIVVNSWQSAVKSCLLDRIYHNANVADLYYEVESRLDHNYIQKEYHHKVTREDVDTMVKEMFRDGWIEANGFKCECCRLRVFSSEEILKHAWRFVLTEKGYEKVHEHIFP